MTNIGDSATMKRETNITSSGIKKVLKNYKYTDAVAEYIWNGFDAKAKNIDISLVEGPLDQIELITVKDDGYGIDVSQLDQKFDRFFDSEKTVVLQTPAHSSVLHGKNGVGRLTFFAFANDAEWHTTYGSKPLSGGKIKIAASNLKSTEADSVAPYQEATGTEVVFSNVTIDKYRFYGEVVSFLKQEFCWFLELNKNKGYSITINSELLSYEDLVIEQEEFVIAKDEIDFKVKYVQWHSPLNNELSKIYFLNSEGTEVYKDFTTLNRKGDHFFHSIYLSSDFFDSFDFRTSDTSQTSLFSKAKGNATYRKVINKITDYIRAKRKPFLRIYGEKLVDDYERAGVFPAFKNSWEELREKELKEIIVGLYEVQPKIFVNLNLEQKKTFVRFLNLLLESNERENIFQIIDEVVNLDKEDREELAGLLKNTALSKIVSTIKLIEDRYKVVYELNNIVFNDDLKANEVHHLQYLVENHYWLFGEQYSLLTAAEPKFNEALSKFTHFLHNEPPSQKIEHEDKLKEMDIFMCRQEKTAGRIHNVVVELKHPKKKISGVHLTQVKNYMNVILSTPEFNADNYFWDFILVGREFNAKGEIEEELENSKNHGERSLVFKSKNYRIYVKKWSDVINEFELKHQFLDDRLKLERKNLLAGSTTANEAAESVGVNSAALPGSN